jgi:hypothetical protein
VTGWEVHLLDVMPIVVIAVVAATVAALVPRSGPAWCRCSLRSRAGARRVHLSTATFE